ncbi:HupE/UreJ family protein [Paenibacillus sp. J5C_2022]|uniref:HupE/UreJ family protein n=1 Tax=Paenibacillus sp. J5C2022 TaxID=2977129 RepID=UPI0021CF1CA1|nr:HupE/UreJ family protein [Paenibacillus sp. J5C2022]MCU6708649.1 HupE/UreJ family protein [Paenibacillus sp. J5C2022]
MNVRTMNARTFLSLLMFVLLLGTSTPVLAHSESLGYSAITVKGNEINYELFLDKRDLLPQFDANKDGEMDNEEVSSQKEGIATFLRKYLRIAVDSNPLTMELLSIEAVTRDATRGVVFQLQFTADEAIEQFDMHYNLVYEDAPFHKSILSVQAGEFLYQDILENHRKDIQVTMPLSQIDASAQAGTGSVLWKYFVIGIEHILIGYDHLLFLLALVLIAPRFKDALKIVTAFTIAHSITLFLVASGRIHVIPSWVEALIALSICYVAVENLFVHKAKWRWIWTTVFGLIHGMGFAGALADIGLPEHNLIGSLVTFNLGVEAGQIMVLCLLLPSLIWLQRFPWYRKFMLSTSCLIFLVALYWLIERLQ